jgi:hypothetical protein
MLAPLREAFTLALFAPASNAAAQHKMQKGEETCSPSIT